MEIVIATGQGCRSRFWKNTRMTWSEFIERLGTTTRTSETQGEYLNMTKAQQDDIKDVGGFVGGKVKNGRRNSKSIENRTMLTLDADFADEDFCANISLLFGFTYCIYSTHKHTPERPRLRLVIPLSRACTPDEYEAVARMIAYDVGIDMFDDTTYQAHRLMYWPSTSIDGEYVFEHEENEPLDVDATLARYTDWTDVSSWPVSSRTVKALDRSLKKQEDPTQKRGIIGAFCRTYDIHECIERFLPDVYEQCVSSDRYTYKAGSSSCGLVVYEDGKFAYSNHATDPASSKLCNSFDLVRIHLFGDLDADAKEATPINKLPSFLEMSELAVNDDGVKRQLADERQKSASTDFKNTYNASEVESDGNEWQTELEIGRNGDVKASLDNIVIILRNDSGLKNIAFNRHRDGIDVRGKLPWTQIKEGWSESDYAALKVYLNQKYGVYSPTKTKDAVLSVASERAYHPIKEYLDTLEPWDGVNRIDTLLIDYLGAADNSYTRAVMRKTLTAAVARIYKPGVKFDSVLILNGPQGIGKSTFFARLAGKWFSDSLTVTDMRDKTGPEKLQGYWIMELGELAGMRKTEAETIKSFISRTDDKYRASYGISVENHPRRCIIVGSTNAESGFLRDTTGNRRFWPVKVQGGSIKKPWDIAEDEIRQVWAQAKSLYKEGEKLYLEGDEAKFAVLEQTQAMESDEREGLVRAYLDTLLPEDWDRMSLLERRGFLNGYDFGKAETGTVKRTSVCNMEIWCECFGYEQAKLDRADAYKISAIMSKIEGWEKVGRESIPIYGQQRCYKRTSTSSCTS